MAEKLKEIEGLWISKVPTQYKEDLSDYYGDNPNTLLRRVFKFEKNNQKYYLKVGCLGYYIAYINGKRVGDYELNSDWTQYDKTIYFDIYDVTDYLVDGENVIAFELGNGMYNPSPLRLFGKYNLRERLRIIGEPCIIAALYQEDKECILKTDDSWKVGQGPILFNNLYLGERVDLRKSQIGWNLNNFDYTKWCNATIDNNKKGKLTPSYIPKIRKKKKVIPSIIKENDKGNLIVDFEETLSGMINISFNGTEGKNIQLIYAEDLYSDNTADCTSTLVGHVGMVLKESNIKFEGGPGAPELARQLDEIISCEGINNYENKFTYHSFRYIEISGFKKEDIVNIEAYYVYSDVDIIGKINTSNKWINDLYNIAEVTKLNNFHSVFEDCARERLGYGGDILALAPSNLYMFDLSNFYKKIMIDFRQDQTENGGIPETAPYMGIQSNGTGQGEGPILWQLVYPYIVCKCYQYYGDSELISSEYQYLKKQIKYLMSIGIETLEDKCLGDHGSPDTYNNFKVGTPDKKFVACCTYVLFLKYNIYFAKLMNDSIYVKYEEELIKAKEYIDKKFKNEDGTYGDKTQSSYAFAIFSDITEEPKKLCEMFVDKISEDNNSFRTGIFGLMMTYEILNKYGYNEIIENWLFNDNYPSIGYMIKKGMTALSEQFNMKNCSYNHAMLSSYTVWYYEGLAGITVSDDAVRANKIMLKPYFSMHIDEVECTFKSYSGEIKSSWRKEEEKIIWNFTIPKGLECQVTVPEEYNILKTNYIEGSNGEFYMILNNKKINLMVNRKEGKIE